MPVSKSSHMGMASSTCEMMSGGVNIMPTTKQPTITYARFLAIDAVDVAPVQIKSTVAIGISKAIPKAKNNFRTKSR